MSGVAPRSARGEVALVDRRGERPRRERAQEGVPVLGARQDGAQLKLATRAAASRSASERRFAAAGRAGGGDQVVAVPGERAVAAPAARVEGPADIRRARGGQRWGRRRVVGSRSRRRHLFVGRRRQKDGISTTLRCCGSAPSPLTHEAARCAASARGLARRSMLTLCAPPLCRRAGCRHHHGVRPRRRDARCARPSQVGSRLRVRAPRRSQTPGARSRSALTAWCVPCIVPLCVQVSSTSPLSAARR